MPPLPGDDASGAKEGSGPKSKLPKPSQTGDLTNPPPAAAKDGSAMPVLMGAGGGPAPQGLANGVQIVGGSAGAPQGDVTEAPKRPPSRSARRKATKRMLRRTGVLPYTGEGRRMGVLPYTGGGKRRVRTDLHRFE